MEMWERSIHFIQAPCLGTPKVAAVELPITARTGPLLEVPAPTGPRSGCMIRDFLRVPFRIVGTRKGATANANIKTPPEATGREIQARHATIIMGTEVESCQHRRRP